MLRSVLTTFRRAIQSDLPRVTASKEEKARLITCIPPIVDRLPQSYIVWRKSVLILASAALAALFVFEVATRESFVQQAAVAVVAAEPDLQAANRGRREQAVEEAAVRIRATFGDANLRVMDRLNWVLILSTLLGAIFAGIAALYWHRPRVSRTWARAAWVVIFVTPFILSLLPVSRMLDWDMVDPGVRETLRGLFGVIFAMTFFMMVGPKAISLAPAIVRSSMTLKTLLPESTVPGWTAVLGAPLLVLFVTIVVSVIIQIDGSIWLLMGAICLLGAPAVYLASSASLIEPQPWESAERIVRRVRRTSSIFVLLAALLIGVFFFRSVTLDVSDGVRFALSVLGSVLTLKVVASDLIIALLWTAHQDAIAFHQSSQLRTLDKRFHALVSADLT